MGFKEVIKTASSIIPEALKPKRKPTLKEKFIWTALAIVAYLIMAETPLFGITGGAADPLGYARVIFASSRGTLMELGIGPIVTAGLIMQLLKGSEIIKMDFRKPEERGLFTSATKLLTIIVILVEASAFVFGGILGTGLTGSTIVVIMVQLVGASILVMLLDEMVQKGWGIGSGISLFILAGVAQSIIWSIFSPLPVAVSETQSVPFGFVPFVIDSALRGAITESIFRAGALPSLFGFIVTIIIMLIILYIEGVRIEIPITSTRFRGFSGVYPIKLLYTSVIPVILASALLTTVTLFTQFIFNSYNPAGDNPWISWIGTFDQNGPVGGLAYYLTSPRSLEGLALDPLRGVTFVIFMVIACVIFARIWVEIGGLGPKQVAKQLLDSQVQVPGFRRSGASVETILGRYIPAVTIVSGIFIGLLASVSDLFGAFGSGTGILLMIDIILNLYQALMKERVEEMMPTLAGMLGKR